MLHVFMPSECVMVLYNALISIETITALWWTDLIFLHTVEEFGCVLNVTGNIWQKMLLYFVNTC